MEIDRLKIVMEAIELADGDEVRNIAQYEKERDDLAVETSKKRRLQFEGMTMLAKWVLKEEGEVNPRDFTASYVDDLIDRGVERSAEAVHIINSYPRLNGLVENIGEENV